MPYPYPETTVQQTVLLNSAVSTTGINSAVLDVSTLTGLIGITVSARTGGTNTMAIAVTMDDASNGSFATPVPAAALTDREGVPDTFDSVSTTASTQTLWLNKERCRRFIRVQLSGTSLTHQVAIFATAQTTSSEWLS